jgi:hypothetical protein
LTARAAIIQKAGKDATRAQAPKRPIAYRKAEISN